MSVRSWRQIVLDADPDWQRLSRRPWVYEFSNGRRFYQPDNPYESADDLLTIDDIPITIDGDTQTSR